MIETSGIAIVTYLIADYFNRRLHWLHRLLLPSSLLAGFLLLMIGPQIIGKTGITLLPVSFYENTASWPGILISFLFSAMILEPGQPSSKTGLSVVSQGLYVWLIAFLQLTLGYTVVSIFAKDHSELLFAHSIELSFLGGHGASSAFTAVSERLGSRSAADLSLVAATVGILFGLFAGLAIIQFHRRFPLYGLSASLKPANSAIKSDEDQTQENNTSIHQNSTNDKNESEHRVFLSYLIPFVPVFAAFVFVKLSASFFKPIADLPLFFFVIIIAHLCRRPFRRILDRTSVRNFHRLSLEGLILAAVATVSIQVVHDHALILSVLCGGAMLLTVALHFFVAPRLLPYYPDLALVNFGMSTGTTAVGLTLLQAYRGSLPTQPVSVYGLAAPLSAPFIGGGILSLILFPELTIRFSPLLLAGCMLLAACFIAAILIVIRQRQQVD